MSFEKVSNFFPDLSEAEMGDNRTYRFKSFLLKVGERQLFDGDRELPLTPKTFDVLVHLVENAGRLVLKDDLMKAVWPDSFVEEVNIPRSVHHLRKTLGQDGNGNKFIETVPTKGYRFVAAIESFDIPRHANPETVSELTPDTISPSTVTGKHIEDQRWLTLAIKCSAAAAIVFGILIIPILWSSTYRDAEGLQGSVVNDDEIQDGVPAKFYWEMTDVEQVDFVRKRSQYIQTLIGDSPVDLDDEVIRSIKVELDDFVSRNQSVSDRPFREPIKQVYQRAAGVAEEVADYFDAVQMSGALGIYQAMVESEFHQCLISPTGSVGIFQISKKTAEQYDLKPEGHCHIGRNSEVASRYMGDISHELATGHGNGTLSLFAHNVGSARTLEYLRELRGMRIWERSAWAILRNRSALSRPVPDSAERYLARFFAAAVIGETPSVFDLSSQPLSTIKSPRK